MKLFGTDGVRGKAGEFLDSFLAMRLAMAAGIYFKDKAITNNILVGKDTRKSGYMIENAIVSGLTSIGYNVIQIGPMPTPAIAFLTEDMRCDAGIMISASHNPYFDNGIKFFDSHGNKLSEEIEEKIEQIYFDDKLLESSKVTMEQIGRAKRIDDVIGRYIVSIKNSFPKDLTLKSLRVVLDVAHGAAYKVAPTIFKELGAEVIVMSDKPNGLNINDNCGALHPANLAEEVKKLRADVGFAFDGDADRLVVVDEKGVVANGDSLLGVLALHLKEQGKLKSKVVATIMSNGALKEFLNKNKIELETCNVGDKFVLEKLKSCGGNFGGEQSGHIIFSDYAKTGDGLIAALQFSALMLSKKKSASAVLGQIKPYPQLLHNLKISQKKDLAKLKGLRELTVELDKKGINSLFRYSGTENLIRLLLEAKDSKLLEKEMKGVEAFFRKALND
ncbi:phosphoglucosamine mutase [Campylobacter helveticus]|uniref:Phosphoglucosamine mutase n=1 Tax=Campylobacter helveticus TaxID=28898 RepID=A0ABY3L1T5_9BACT|nr:phosphoglucosamine mutase [Campylobacter helveticus]MCR2039297.1 phosphoglucosamine mutase [Campylobacter helveticus]TXK57499.1 phosphoglucosamine mutase [Campylobacter helveticus]